MECDRILHFRFNRIQTHALITDRARLGDHALRQYPAPARAAIVRPHVKPLHFADAGFKFAQPNTTTDAVSVPANHRYPAAPALPPGPVLHLPPPTPYPHTA